MSADKAQLLGLIGLRALAVRDPFEYRRVADLPIPALDREIEKLLKSVPDDECRRLYDQAISISSLSVADPFLDEVAESSFRKANLEAVELESRKPSTEENVESGAVRPESELVNPGAIIAFEMQRAGLTWAVPQISDVMPLRFDVEALTSAVGRGTFLEALGSVADVLSQPNVVVGSDVSLKSALWNICEKILRINGKVLKPDASEKSLLSHARQGKASVWLRKNVRDASAAETPQGT